MKIIDQIGREISLPYPAEKIVSLVPSISDYVKDLKSENSLVGVTKFCDTISSRHLKSIGGTKNPNLNKILDLQPDLVLANKEENRQEDILFLEKYLPVYVSDVFDMASMKGMMLDIGKLTNTLCEAEEIIVKIDKEISTFKNEPEVKKICYLVWNKPYMTIGSDTFIHSLLEETGFINVFNSENRYPTISFQEIQDKAPELIFLSDEPFPFSEQQIPDFAPYEAIVVSGKAFSWYGSMILKSFPYIKALKGTIQN